MLPDLHDLIVGGFKNMLLVPVIALIIVVGYFPIFAYGAFGEEVGITLMFVWLGFVIYFASKRGATKDV